MLSAPVHFIGGAIQNIDVIVIVSVISSLKCKLTGRMAVTAIRPTTSTNLTVQAGASISFGCRTDSESKIRWIFNSPRLREPLVLYSGYGVVTVVSWRVSVHATAGENEITVRNVGTDKAGVYSCHEVRNHSSKVDFRLLVKGASFGRIVSQPETYSMIGLCPVADRAPPSSLTKT